jgi:aspartyl-tRNA(Asn)/glutamyl-tRNA(Gln) amidotransferase subunit A
MAAAFDEFVDSRGPGELTGMDSHRAYSRSAVLAKDYLRALRVRGVVALETDRLLSGYDAIVSPTAHGVVGPIDEQPDSSRAEPVGALGNLAGLPAISVPNGFSDEGMPTGLRRERDHRRGRRVPVADGPPHASPAGLDGRASPGGPVTFA